MGTRSPPRKLEEFEADGYETGLLRTGGPCSPRSQAHYVKRGIMQYQRSSHDVTCVVLFNLFYLYLGE